MKKHLSFAAFLLAAVFCMALIAPLAASAEEVRYEVFDLTSKDAAPEDSSKWYADGVIIAVTNSGSSELTAASGEYPMRYLFLLIFDQDGVCTEIGNNLLTADDEKAASFPQHDIKIPAGGFAILFYYNATEGPSNQALYDYYAALGGEGISNETVKISNSKGYSAELEGNTVTVYFGAKNGSGDEPAASSEEPVEESSEASAEESSAASEETSSKETPSADESSEAEPEDSVAPAEGESEPAGEATASADSTSSEAAAESSRTESAQEEDGGSNLPLILGVVIAVVAVAAIIVIIVAKKKK